MRDLNISLSEFHIVKVPFLQVRKVLRVYEIRECCQLAVNMQVMFGD